MSEKEVKEYFAMMKEAIRLSNIWFKTSANTDEYWKGVAHQSENYIKTCERYHKGEFAKSLMQDIIDELRRVQKEGYK